MKHICHMTPMRALICSLIAGGISLGAPAQAQALEYGIYEGEGCPAGYTPLTTADAFWTFFASCDELPYSGVFRLADGDSIDGQWNSCQLNTGDTRELDYTLCKPNYELFDIDGTTFAVVRGGEECLEGFEHVDFATASAYSAEICTHVGYWGIARIGGGGSIDGVGYGCGIRATDSRPLGDAICVESE
ncbi:hypothetical protein SOCEGT47_033710 [Sorangium cellulosum]|uniref:Secreted protein n=1 Tax=Sorangium cellulosum TaxID=56 RepID=A0A4P2Q0X1_SORCE|nr:hypothetical protein [Sorangium cellulosum]AUX22855.1 hypothetical protein SOCEGT47_033710 [Sorangium cellulosum]